MIALTRQEKLFLIFIGFLALAGLVYSSLKRPSGCNSCLIHFYKAPVYPINVNEATRQALIEIPGIGEKLAEDIIQLRQAGGGIRHLDELTKIKGIGDTRLDNLKNYLKI